ncbi:hypothetical protein B7R21_17615 [Subtercola boreus]|uniref:DinB family protein n=1 Tax=Subtercola boreus TaxID=120213 RepID=A0A3E0VBL8_9MICO|nr:DinB family protein [Subtercola boreus]RFA06933.1 hypothetical protein B7R21_17615 [Subtercola boreus]
MDEKETLHGYLRIRRADLLGTLDGLSEYDMRRPLTPSGTNLLGLVKHVASVQLGYFGEVFERPATHPVAEQITALDAAGAAAATAPAEGEPAPPPADAESLADAFEDADLWVPATQSSADILDFHHFSAAHADATIEVLDLASTGSVPWWQPERRTVTLHQILVHMIAETARHAGHADIVRELIDGRLGNGPADPNIPTRSAASWAAYRSRIEEAARAASSD